MLSFTAVHLDDYRFCAANTISGRYLSLNAPAVANDADAPSIALPAVREQQYRPDEASERLAYRLAKGPGLRFHALRYRAIAELTEGRLRLHHGGIGPHE